MRNRMLLAFGGGKFTRLYATMTIGASTELLDGGARTYKDAIAALNQLQSNAMTIQMTRKYRNIDPTANIHETKKFLQALDITTSDLDRLNVIHIAGTKGKGSTAMLTECILRHHGHKTGLFTSPHLKHATERIRINGVEMSDESFARYFWQIYDKVALSAKASALPMPAYFKFLTIMCLQVFISEQVDVAIVEVGIGGRYDSTNIFDNPWVTAVTTLDYDHTQLLGKTMREIAHQKGGIYKRGATTLTAAGQDDEALPVLHRCAENAQSRLQIAPASVDVDIGISGEHQKLNAALAVHVASAWMQRKRQGASTYMNASLNLPPIELTDRILTALKSVDFAGRSQVIENVGGRRLHLFCDGAHTIKSVDGASKWFTDSSSTRSSANRTRRTLIYCCTGDRDPQPLLTLLNRNCRFDTALFTSRAIDRVIDIHDDKTSMISEEWSEYQQSLQQAAIWRQLNATQEPEIYRCARHAFERVLAMADSEPDVEQHVFITGSFHLVGSFLSILDDDSDPVR